MFSSALKSFSSNISTNYTISATPSSIAGAWKVFDGKKKSTGKLVSVFVFDRKSLEPQGGSLRSRSNGASRRKIHDEVVERMKKEASSLARLRHPNILELAEPVEDTRNGGLMFATEPIASTLAGLLHDQDESERAGGSRGRSGRYRTEDDDGRPKEVEIDELEIQKGLLQVAKGLEFLHESAGLVHGNLTPEAIYVNQKSDWKISGLGFSGPPDVSTSNTSSSGPPIALSELLYHDPRLPRSVQLNLDYTSPDFVMDSNISSAADMFSLGLVILALYNAPHESPVHTNCNITTYKKVFASPSSVPSSNNNFLLPKPLPKQLSTDVLPRLITRRPAQRMNAREFQQSQFFDNILVSTIRFLDSLPAKSSNEKAQFMRGLPRILEQFPKPVLERKVLPALLEETKDRDLLALVLGNVFKITKLLSSGHQAFTEKVLPKLREIFSVLSAKGPSTERDTSKEAGLVVILENMSLITENCFGKAFKDDILPIIRLGLESPTHSLVDRSLSILPIILPTLDFSTIKNELFPLVATIFSKTSSLAIKVRGLEAFVILCGGSPPSTTPTPTSKSITNSSAILDKYTVQEKVVPLLKAIKTKEPTVMMAALSVFKQVSQIADADFLAIDVLPILWSFSLGPLLNLQQFKEYMDLIKAISQKIEDEQTRKLRELASGSTNGFDTTRSTDLMSVQPSNDPFGNSSLGEDDFERLVLGKAPSSQTSSPSTMWPPQPSSSLSNVLSAQSSNSRAITPDHTLPAFAALKPSPNTFATTSHSAWAGIQPMQPIQPLQSRPASNPWANPTSISTNLPQTNAWTTVPSQNVQTPWTLPTPPGNRIPAVRGYSDIAPKTQGQNGIGTVKPNEKKGLDAYESLI